jgi:hypothetical protein
LDWIGDGYAQLESWAENIADAVIGHPIGEARDTRLGRYIALKVLPSAVER